MKACRLPFSVRQARSEADFAGARAVRVAAYGHHLAWAKEAMLEPDPVDQAPGSCVLIAVSTDSGGVVGTLRLLSNMAGPLQVQQCVPGLAGALGDTHLCEVTRLAIDPLHCGEGVTEEVAPGLVRLGLWKAAYLSCVAAQVRHMVVGARSAALLRGYKQLGFTSCCDEPVPLPYAGGIKHFVLSLDVTGAERLWHGEDNRLYRFMCIDVHPQLACTGQWAAQRHPLASHTVQVMP